MKIGNWTSWRTWLRERLPLREDERWLQEEWSEECSLPGIATPLTAREAFVLALRFAATLEPRPAAKWIAATEGLGRDGTARRWEFGFELPTRVATLSIAWSAPSVEAAARGAPATLRGHALPFPWRDAGGGSRREARRRREEAWSHERRRRPDLPTRFLDSPEVLVRLLRLGLDPYEDGVALSTGREADGRAVWVAVTRKGTLREPLAT